MLYSENSFVVDEQLAEDELLCDICCDLIEIHATIKDNGLSCRHNFCTRWRWLIVYQFFTLRSHDSRFVSDVGKRTCTSRCLNTPQVLSLAHCLIATSSCPWRSSKSTCLRRWFRNTSGSEQSHPWTQRTFQNYVRIPTANVCRGSPRRRRSCSARLASCLRSPTASTVAQDTFSVGIAGRRKLTLPSHVRTGNSGWRDAKNSQRQIRNLDKAFPGKDSVEK